MWNNERGGGWIFMDGHFNVSLLKWKVKQYNFFGLVNDFFFWFHWEYHENISYVCDLVSGSACCRIYFFYMIFSTDLYIDVTHRFSFMPSSPLISEKIEMIFSMDSYFFFASAARPLIWMSLQLTFRSLIVVVHLRQ